MHGSFQEQQVLPQTLASSQLSSQRVGNSCEPLHRDPTFSPAFLFCLEQQDGAWPPHLP